MEVAYVRPFLITDFSVLTLINYASSSLRLPWQCIKDKFRNWPMCLSEFIENQESTHSIEIRFDDEQATLVFSFDAAMCCDCIFVYPDRLVSIGYFAQSLTNLYPRYAEGKWMLPGSLMEQKEADGITTFVLSSR